ncbi:Uncharacterized protein dnm_029220 [Desulfonema magnum]|uniref:Uncharacterized protein n=1 Tax=Desulfonema magnum TaxID=45655 RepID=A0A975BKD3_9BACT|nr:Uncharacterized protein dnm_029220 [Desulfonema magnum]
MPRPDKKAGFLPASNFLFFCRMGFATHTHQAEAAGRGLQPRPKHSSAVIRKHSGRGCKLRPANNVYYQKEVLP